MSVNKYNEASRINFWHKTVYIYVYMYNRYAVHTTTSYIIFCKFISDTLDTLLNDITS